MNNTSPSLKFVSSAARSPGFSIAGPEVTRICTCISLAIMPASVVLPSPGGPYKSTWSSCSPRAFAASIYTFKFSFAFSCPIYSFKVFGRRESSVSLSASLKSGETMRFSLSKSISYTCFASRFNACLIKSSTESVSGSPDTATAASLWE